MEREFEIIVDRRDTKHRRRIKRGWVGNITVGSVAVGLATVRAKCTYKRKQPDGHTKYKFIAVDSCGKMNGRG